MAKKLLGERQIGETVYEAGKIFSDEEAAATGLPASDFATVSAPAAAAPAQETAAAPADKDAEVDAQAASGEAEKKEGEQSSQVGSDDNGASGTVSESGGENGASSSEAANTDETVEHVLTEQDLTDNPEFATQGLKVGDTVRVKKEAQA